MMLRIITNDITANAANGVMLRINIIALYSEWWYNHKCSEVLAMAEDKLSDLSMKLSVDVLRLTK
mgnify:CR=1 FL=1